MVVEWSPHVLELLFILAVILILVVDSAVKPGIKAHFCEETRVCIGMTEGVDVPANSGSVAKLLHQEFMALHHIINHIIIMRVGLVMHAPASIDEIQAALLHQKTHLLLHLLSLHLPPH